MTPAPTRHRAVSAVCIAVIMVCAELAAGCAGQDDDGGSESTELESPRATKNNGGNNGGNNGAVTAQRGGVQIGASFGDGKHDFGTIPVGRRAILFMEIRKSIATVEITNVSVTGQWFSLVDATQCQGALLTAQHSTCTVEIAYRPGAVGHHAGRFSVSGLAGERPARHAQDSSSPSTSSSGSGAVGPEPPDDKIAPDQAERKPTGAGLPLLGKGV